LPDSEDRESFRWGQIIAYSAMIEEKEISWMPSYGPEMRGGTANCIVIVSPERISSPIISRFDSVIALNQPSLDKFEHAVKPGGLLLYEKSTIINPPTRTDIEVIGIPANEEAQKLGKKQVANMIMVGALLERRPIVKIENIIKSIEESTAGKASYLIPLNEQALSVGSSIVNVLSKNRKQVEHTI